MSTPDSPSGLSLSQPVAAQSSVKAGGPTSTGIEGDKPAPATVKEDCMPPIVVVSEEVVGKAQVEAGITINRDNDRSSGDVGGDVMEVSEGAAVEEKEEERTRSRGEREEGTKRDGPSTEVSLPSKLQRFYFESDTLALKNNPE